MDFRDRIKDMRRVKASELRANPRNWRKHPRRQREVLRGLINDVGFATAILARETPEGLEIIDGHLRMEEAGDNQVPVIVLDVDAAEAAKLLVTIDPLAGLAETDQGQLDSLLAEISSTDAAVNDLLEELRGFTLEPAINPDGIDDIPEVPLEPVTKAGDLWLLGQHRLLCGDSTSAENVARLLDGAKPYIMVTDPPYGVEYDPKWRHDLGLNKSGRTGKVQNDDKADWTAAWKLFPGSVGYVWYADKYCATVQTSLESAGFAVRAQLVWVKPRMVLSRGHYHWKHEPAFQVERPGEDIQELDPVCEQAWYSVRKGASADWRGGRKQTTVWEIGFTGEVATQHGTQKPVECMARPIRNHGDKDGSVYDPFLGSGTTLIAAELLGRQCYGLELSPAYCDVIVKRWETLTGKKAVLAN